jgi:hypothetical protein
VSLHLPAALHLQPGVAHGRVADGSNLVRRDVFITP